MVLLSSQSRHRRLLRLSVMQRCQIPYPAKTAQQLGIADLVLDSWFHVALGAYKRSPFVLLSSFFPIYVTSCTPSCNQLFNNIYIRRSVHLEWVLE